MLTRSAEGCSRVVVATGSAYPLDEPVSLSVTILAPTELSNASLRVWSVVSSDKPLTKSVLVGPGVEREREKAHGEIIATTRITNRDATHVQ